MSESRCVRSTIPMKPTKHTLIIGDLHAPKSLGAVDAMIDRTAPGAIVLLGDYLDHFGDGPAE
jgi:predicted phosphodiesterase